VSVFAKLKHGRSENCAATCVTSPSTHVQHRSLFPLTASNLSWRWQR